ncbi:MAG: mandelate racemase/muconate lactonizing enzyme family protein [SAR202 cluster bacterium]|nr:mandelate racemase/muconate lactonizing enzyme family protein [SAR202 cluster bacterium]
MRTRIDPDRASTLKITRIETINVAEFPAVTWVQVYTDAGHVGLGETWFGPRSVVGAIHEIFSPILIGKNPLDIERHWRDMFDMANAFGYAGAETRALSALDIALWDIAGQEAKQPIYNLLGGACRDRIRVYNTCAQYGANRDMEMAFFDPGGLARSLLDEGISIMKWAFTDHFADLSRGVFLSEQDLELMQEPIRQIRKAVGNQMAIANDGHGRWNLQNAIRIGRAMDQYGMFWQEELIQPTNVENHLALAREVEAPICVSERLVTKYQFRDYLRAGAAEVVMPDLIWTGGITETKKIAVMAEAEQAPVAPHDCTGPVNVFACAHICMNAPNVMVMETVRAFYGKSGYYGRFIEPNIVVRDGFLLAPEGPGLGTRLKKDVRERSDATVESSDSPGGDHWGGLHSPFEVVDSGGKRLVRLKSGSNPGRSRRGKKA